MTGVLTWNKSIAPAGADGWNLTPDVRKAIEAANFTVPVASTTERDALTPPAGKYPGMKVVRTDLPGCPEETWDGSNWQGVSWVSYTPTWAGWVALGTGFVSTGSYLLIGKLCMARMKLVGGSSGTNMGTGNLAVSLPFTSAADQATLGEAEWLGSGVTGELRKVILSNPPSNGQASLLSWPGGNAIAATPGSASFPYGSTTEIHATITYKVA